MVTNSSKSSAADRARAGFLTTELIVAMLFLFVAVIPLAYSFLADVKLLRAGYERAIAVELVDGEMEILAAGAWRAFSPGTHDYPLTGTAATNLPPGRCQLTIAPNLIQIEWRPDQHRGVGAVVREVRR